MTLLNMYTFLSLYQTKPTFKKLKHLLSTILPEDGLLVAFIWVWCALYLHKRNHNRVLGSKVMIVVTKSPQNISYSLYSLLSCRCYDSQNLYNINIHYTSILHILLP